MLQRYFCSFLAAFVLFVGLYNFQTSPGFWFDEGIIAQAAKNIAFNGVYGIQTAPGSFYTNNFWITTGYPLMLPVAFFLKIFGASIWAARIAPLLYLLLFAAVSYFFIKKLYGFKYAVLASLLLVTFPPLYGNGKAVLGEVPGLFWLVLGGFLYLLYEEKKRDRFIYASALAFGLCVAAKPYYALIIPGVIFLVLFLRFKRPNFGWRKIILFTAVFSLPVLLWIFLAFDLSSPQNFSATLSYFLNSYGATSFEPLKNLFRFVSESTPIHFTVLALTVFVSLFIALKNKDIISPIAPLFLIFIVLAFLWYLKTPGWYRYFFPAHIIVILLFPAALGTFINRFSSIAVISAIITFQTAFLFLNYNDFYGDDVLKLKKYAEESLKGSASVMVVSKPEAAFILDNKKLYQHIFISENFELGEDVSKYGAIDYLIGESLDKNIPDYSLVDEIGHYRIYRRI